MSNPFILITGDDSVRAEGIILLKRIVEPFADYQIIATKDQQSCIGAALQLRGGTWGTEKVDGHEAIWVDGYPSDCMYFAKGYYQGKRKIDLVLSGMNLGDNIENTTLPRSGTVSAAWTAALEGYNSVAFSIRVNNDSWLKEHNGEFDEKLIEYPGGLVRKVIKNALDYDFQKNEFWNVNFPSTKTDTIKPVFINSGGSYPNNMIVDKDKYRYDHATIYDGWGQGTDAGELERGNATICTCRVDFNDKQLYNELRKVF